MNSILNFKKFLLLEFLNFRSDEVGVDLLLCGDDWLLPFFVVVFIGVVHFNEDFSVLAYHDSVGLAVGFHFVCNDGIGPEDIVPDDIGAGDSSIEVTSVDADSHVQVLQVELDPDSPYNFDHCQPHVNHVFGFHARLPLLDIGDSKDDVAV